MVRGGTPRLRDRVVFQKALIIEIVELQILEAGKRGTRFVGHKRRQRRRKIRTS
jgi:hypothetical protein